VRHGISRRDSRRLATALAVIVLVFQFGVVQHTASHGLGHGAQTCAVCMTGGQPTGIHALPLIDPPVVIMAALSKVNSSGRRGAGSGLVPLARAPPALC